MQQQAAQQQAAAGQSELRALLTAAEQLAYLFQFGRLPADLQLTVHRLAHGAIGEVGQFRQLLGEPRQRVLDPPQYRPGLHLLRHPALHEGFGGAPQVELGIQLAPQALDVEQGLLQQHQLRLDLHVETARGLEQAQQEVTEGDLADRFLPYRFADRADRRLELVHPGIARHPAGFDMQFGHPAVVAVEEGEQILREVALVLGGEGAHDAEVDPDIAPLGGDEDIPRVHVGMEEVVAEHLGEEYLHAAHAEHAQVYAGASQLVDMVHRYAVDALLYQHVPARVVPVDLGDVQHGAVLEVAPQQGAVGGLAHQVQLVVDGLLVLLDHLHRAQPAGLAGIAPRHARDGIQQRDVALDGLLDPGADHLDHHLAAVVQARGMHLRDRGGGQRPGVEFRKQLAHRCAQRLFDNRLGLCAGEGRHLVLQLAQFLGDVVRQQVAPGGQDLAELDVHRTEVLERPADAHPARCAPPQAGKVEGREITQEADRPEQVRGEDDLVQPVAHQHPGDMGDPQTLTQGDHGRRDSSSAIRAARRSTSSRVVSTSSIQSSTS